MKIREAVVADYPALLAIAYKFFEFNPYRHDTTIDEESLVRLWDVLRTSGVLLTVEVEGQVVGTAGAFIAPLYWNNNYLQGVEAFWWVDEAHRGNGAGKALRIALQAAAKDRGVQFWNMIALEDSMPEQVGAQYVRAGFKPVERVYMKVI
jgi:L-amino acid N-acyltransferase YncA